MRYAFLALIIFFVIEIAYFHGFLASTAVLQCAVLGFILGIEVMKDKRSS